MHNCRDCESYILTVNFWYYWSVQCCYEPLWPHLHYCLIMQGWGPKSSKQHYTQNTHMCSTFLQTITPAYVHGAGKHALTTSRHSAQPALNIHPFLFLPLPPPHNRSPLPPLILHMCKGAGTHLAPTGALAEGPPDLIGG